MSQAEIYDSSPLEVKATEEVKEALNPIYVPTPSNRPLRTPHSGYHFDGTRRKFFEGWYFKVSIPERRQSFCFMYSVENPAFRKKLSNLEQLQYGQRFTGVGAQILGPDDEYICQYTEESHNFWGSKFMWGQSKTEPDLTENWIFKFCRTEDQIEHTSSGPDSSILVLQF